MAPVPAERRPAAMSAAPAMMRIARPWVLLMNVTNDMALTSVVVGVALWRTG
jgi:hypothetical protein